MQSTKVRVIYTLKRTSTPTKIGFVGWKGTWNTSVRIGSDKTKRFVGLTTMQRPGPECQRLYEEVVLPV